MIIKKPTLEKGETKLISALIQKLSDFNIINLKSNINNTI